MKGLKTKKQIAECLKEANVTLWDKQTRRELTNNAIDLLIGYITTAKTNKDFVDLIEADRFAKSIDDFNLENKSDNKELEFYAQHKSEINRDKNKKLVFQKKFKIEDFAKFKLSFKKKEWYLPDFYDDELRTDIISDQSHRCAMCNTDVSGINPHLHHIDYNKTNCDRANLVFVCPRCHGKTNSNRPFWKDLLIERQKEIIDGRPKTDAREPE